MKHEEEETKTEDNVEEGDDRHSDEVHHEGQITPNKASRHVYDQQPKSRVYSEKAGSNTEFNKLGKSPISVFYFF